MAGRIDLHWNGRDITIERRTKRRIPLGEFQAYETDSGLPVAELTASNCGAMLLGVEQSVFRRAGFIRHADLPVTQDEALRRRLNALVTTGDDSGAADRLAEELKILKNRCRYNRSGLLPQAEAERDALADKIREMDDLNIQIGNLEHQVGEIKNWLKQLYNHQQAQAYAKMQEDEARIAETKASLEQLQQEMASSDSYSEISSLSYLAQILVLLNRLARQATQESPRQSQDSVVYYILSYINEHYNEDLSLDFLANEFFISKDHLSREFSRVVGTSVHRYIVQKRLIMARQMMAAGTSTSEVSQLCGFGDYSNFYRAFTGEYQISPRKYLEELKKENPIHPDLIRLRERE